MNKIIQYWIFSFKDKKWSYEEERRFELVMLYQYKYFELEVDTRFLKLKNTILSFPDFVNIENINHTTILDNRRQKLRAISTKPYLFCYDCLQSDYDAVLTYKENESHCSVCGSTNLQKIDRSVYE